MSAVPRFAYDHAADQRNCALYYVDVLDAATNYTTVRRNAYIGETGREPFIRFMEHLYDQPFGDIIVGMPRVDPRVFGTKDEVLAAEREAVRRLLPQYNQAHQPAGNPHRIPVGLARQHRDERDRARGLQPRDWSTSGGRRQRLVSPPTAAGVRPPSGRPLRRSFRGPFSGPFSGPFRRPVHRPPTAPSRRLARQRRRRRNSMLGWSAVWLSAALSGWGMLQHYAELPLVVELRIAAVAGVLPCAGWHAAFGRNRRRRAMGRWAAGGAVAVAAFLLARP